VSGKRASQIRSTHSWTAGLTRDPIDCWSRGDGTPSSLAARVITCSVEGGRGRCAWTNYRSWTGQALRIMDRCDPRVMSQSYDVKVFGRRAAPSRAANAGGGVRKSARNETAGCTLVGRAAGSATRVRQRIPTCRGRRQCPQPVRSKFRFVPRPFRIRFSRYEAKNCEKWALLVSRLTLTW
jgi:hypothetical protein